MKWGRASLGLLLVIHLVLAALGSARTTDDAFITFRYSRNLIEGRGLFFNPGERVEGYTNFLWLLVLAGLMPVLNPVAASKILGVACNLAVISLLFRFGIERRARHCFWFPAAFLALDPGFCRWSTRGLETSPFALACLATFLLVSSRPVLAGLAGGAATLLRPEGLLVFSVCIAAGLGFERQWRAARRSIVSYGAIIGPYLLFKLAYFGDLLPNTYYAKTGGGKLQWFRGLSYLVHGYGAAELALVSLAVYLLYRGGWRQAPSRTAFLVAATFACYILLVGGDSLGVDRFLVPVTLFLVIAGAPRRGMAGVLLAASLILQNGWPLKDRLFHPQIYNTAYEQGHRLTILGKCLKAHAKPGDSIATSLIGRVPYYSGLFTLDELGLVDRHIAHMSVRGAGFGAAGHEKGDPAYILARRPTFIIAGRFAELVVGKPKEPRWLAWLRRRVLGDLRAAPSPTLRPPFEGYRLEPLRCGERTIRLWVRRERSMDARVREGRPRHAGEEKKAAQRLRQEVDRVFDDASREERIEGREGEEEPCDPGGYRETPMAVKQDREDRQGQHVVMLPRMGIAREVG